jgi:hypothetical protein
VYGDQTEARVNQGPDADRIHTGKIRADAALRQHQAGSPMQNMERGECNAVRQGSIRERIDRALSVAEYTSKRAAIAYRAKQIIDQHPEFAELLDLLNELSL